MTTQALPDGPHSMGFVNDDGSSVDITYTYTPPPPAVRTLVGGTPRGASTAAGVSAMDKTYGAKTSVVRLFSTGDPVAVPVTDRKVVGSFNTLPADLGAVAAILAGYWRKSLRHEIDKAAKDNDAVRLQWQAQMGSLVRAGVQGLQVCVTADCFVNPDKDPTRFLVDGVTHWSVDFDGISPSATSIAYHDYSHELAAVVAFGQKYGLTMSVGEFGANRGAFDPAGTARALWALHWATQFQAAALESVCFWEQTSTLASTWSTDAEIATLRALFVLAA